VIVFSDGSIDPDRLQVLENFVCLHSIPSSNALARDLIDMYFEEDQKIRPTVLAAEAQPGAYGRNGRTWAAPAGQGLYFTILRRPAQGEPLSVVPIAFARWVREVLQRETGVAVALKWPNDLYVGRRKLAGVLAESRTQGDETGLAVGIGINVLGASDALGAPNATTLQEESGRPISLASLLQAVLERVDAELAEPKWADEIRAWEGASLHRPGDVLIVRRAGEEVRGEYLGLDPAGFLRLKTSSGETVVATGEVAQW
jgi:BirA family transcriptional regulator, biotin operon repressor / biotin---[acetyl-CoA-carboxylase] ligase